MPMQRLSLSARHVTACGHDAKVLRRKTSTASCDHAEEALTALGVQFDVIVLALVKNMTPSFP
jgi:hypothetical protein